MQFKFIHSLLHLKGKFEKHADNNLDKIVHHNWKLH